MCKIQPTKPVGTDSRMAQHEQEKMAAEFRRIKQEMQTEARVCATALNQVKESLITLKQEVDQYIHSEEF